MIQVVLGQSTKLKHAVTDKIAGGWKVTVSDGRVASFPTLSQASAYADKAVAR